MRRGYYRSWMCMVYLPMMYKKQMMRIWICEEGLHELSYCSKYLHGFDNYLDCICFLSRAFSLVDQRAMARQNFEFTAPPWGAFLAPLYVVSAWCLWPSQVSGSASNLLLLVFSAYSGLAEIDLRYQQLIYDIFSNYRYYSGNSKGLIIVCNALSELLRVNKIEK